ncbi:MAG TPA: hypothetical protein VGQ66_03625 [Candidatus Limnocylindria bacterium]|jgi:hypothetical protein|nr:hypothetical protein [Candidatus Limnocylindria bacterium]
MLQRATLLIATAALGLSGCLASPPQDRLEGYLRAVAGGEPDRGWQYLAEATREIAYQSDKAAYVADAAAADWEAFRWSPPTVLYADDGFSYVSVRLTSGAASVPRFLIARWLLNGICEGNTFEPVGLAVMLRDSGESGIAAGGWTGSQVRCNRRFVGDAFEEPPS